MKRFYYFSLSLLMLLIMPFFNEPFRAEAASPSCDSKKIVLDADRAVSEGSSDVCFEKDIKFKWSYKGNSDEVTSWKWNINGKDINEQYKDNSRGYSYKPSDTENEPDVILTAVKKDGSTECVEKKFNLARVPAADFSYEVSSGKDNKFVFKNKSTNYTGESTWRWDFGDSITSEEKDHKHKFNAPGIYNVKLTAYNGKCTSTLTRNVNVGDCNKADLPEVIQTSDDTDKYLKYYDACKSDKGLKRMIEDNLNERAKKIGSELTEKVERVKLNDWISPQQSAKPAGNAQAGNESAKTSNSNVGDSTSNQFASLVNELQSIRKAIPLHQKQNFSDYGGFYRNFYIGFDYVNSSKTPQKGFFDIDYTAYWQTSKSTERFGGCRWDPLHWFLPPHFAITGRLANTAETPANTSGTGNTTANAPKSALEIEGMYFQPVYAHQQKEDGDEDIYIGPVITTGARKIVSDGSAVSGRLYGGIRLARNPEQYFDMMIGYTKGDHNKRVEVRSQLPVHSFSDGSRLFLGLIENAGISRVHNSNAPKSQDVLRIYLKWDVDFGSVMTKLSLL